MPSSVELTLPEFDHLIRLLFAKYQERLREKEKECPQAPNAAFWGVNDHNINGVPCFYELLFAEEKVRQKYNQNTHRGKHHLYDKYQTIRITRPRPTSVTLRNHHADIYFLMLGYDDQVACFAASQLPIPYQAFLLENLEYSPADPNQEKTETTDPEPLVQPETFSHWGYFYSYRDHVVKKFQLHLDKKDGKLKIMLRGLASKDELIYSGEAQHTHNSQHAFVTLTNQDNQNQIFHLSLGISNFQRRPTEMLQGSITFINQDGYLLSVRVVAAQTTEYSEQHERAIKRYLLLRQSQFRARCNANIQKVEDLKFRGLQVDDYSLLVGRYLVLMQMRGETYLLQSLEIKEDLIIYLEDRSLLQPGNQHQVGIISTGSDASRLCISFYPRSGTILLSDLHLKIPERIHLSKFFEATFLPFPLSKPPGLQHCIVFTRANDSDEIELRQHTLTEVKDLCDKDQNLSLALDMLTRLKERKK